MHAAVMVSLFEIRSDGRIAYERSRCKPYRRGLPGQTTRQSEQDGSEVPQWGVSRTEAGNRRDVDGHGDGCCQSRSDQAKDRAETF